MMRCAPFRHRGSRVDHTSITAWPPPRELRSEALTPDDIRFFGGKAANYGLLRRTIPDHCPHAIAISFDLWDAYLGQPLAGGSTLRSEIASRLAPHQSYPPQIGPLRIALAGIRALITDSADFTQPQREALVTALSPFTPGRKIRFRSSTNVEDAEQFTGAGLYDSYSGCLLDDLDADTSGPSNKVFIPRSSGFSFPWCTASSQVESRTTTRTSETQLEGFKQQGHPVREESHQRLSYRPRPRPPQFRFTPNPIVLVHRAPPSSV